MCRQIFLTPSGLMKEHPVRSRREIARQGSIDFNAQWRTKPPLLTPDLWLILDVQVQQILRRVDHNGL